MARTSDDRTRGGVSCFVVPTESPGLSVDMPERDPVSGPPDFGAWAGSSMSGWPGEVRPA